MAWARALEAGRRPHYRRTRPRRGVCTRARRDAERRAVADGLFVPLRLRHAHRRCRVYYLVHGRRGSRLMLSWPILSVTTFLPLVGALFIMLMASEGEAEKRNARWRSEEHTSELQSQSNLVCRLLLEKKKKKKNKHKKE